MPKALVIAAFLFSCFQGNAAALEAKQASFQQYSQATRDRSAFDMAGAIAAWIFSNLALPKVDTLPSIQFQHSLVIAEKSVSRASPALDRILFSEMVPDDALPASYHRISYYDEHTKTVYLPASWNAENPIMVSLIVRELTRYIQHVAGINNTCPEIRAGLAYSAQEMWLSDRGLSLEREFGVSSDMVSILSRCLPIP